ncbi:lipoate--protein ligase family protein [Cyanobium gracile UHCC 0139]|uniref:Lipoate--protein ligase family protein n=1 Tax=Cyanobium gracile UHCC 0139 TaxID=3110308 RepID=A0ABU5RW58_9CYAN|nr:lipoate--protein ligase family protein [Cyanobium gracile]MEA5392007.1 lipoate--protein ligase family protein [Cyanobium gracile UHCC 0139]
MAIDAWLLEGPPTPAFRLYRWSRPTLSLGWHQRRLEPHWWDLRRQGRIDLVRRPSGGRAVLHGADLTYALVWPRPQGTRSEVYGRALTWLVEAFAAMDLPLQCGRQAASLQRSSCFATSTVADLVHPSGAKRVGSAQLWRGGHLLQHGSIQLDPCPHLWRAVFGGDPPDLAPLPLAGNDLEEHLLGSAARFLPWPSVPDPGVEPLSSSRPPLAPLGGEELASIEPLRVRYRMIASATGSPSPSVERPLPN